MQTGNFSTDTNDSYIAFKDPGGDIRFSLPIGYAWELNNESHSITLRYRLIKQNNEFYLLAGAPVSWFTSATYPVVVDPSTTVYTGTSDGYITYSNYCNWSTAHAATSGLAYANHQYDDMTMSAGEQSGSGTYYWIYRGFFMFDTSGLPDTCQVTNATLQVYGYGEADSSVCAMKGTQGDSLDQYDFDNFEGSEYGHVAWSTSGYNTITFNGAGRADVSKTGTTYVCCREYNHDYLNVDPGADQEYRNGCYWANYEGTSRDPKLSIEYIDIPLVSTSTADSLSTSSFRSGGYNLNDQGSTITEKGIQWGTTTPPSTKTSFGSGGTSNYSVTKSGLPENTKYYYRAYVTNAVGDGFGSILNAYTLAAPPADNEFTVDGYGTTWINMSVVDADQNPTADLTGAYFECMTGGASASGWTASIASGRYYYNATGLTPGVTYGYRVKYRNGDGINTTSTSEKQQTTIPLPTVDAKTPVNGSTGVAPIPPVTCVAYVNDTDGDQLTVTWATNVSGTWVKIHTNGSVPANSTLSYQYTEFNDYNTTYYWRVYVNDGTSNVSETYRFMTLTINTWVNPITPYNQTIVPVSLTADSVELVPDNITLYYRWSMDNVSWDGGAWAWNNNTVDTNASNVDEIPDIGSETNFSSAQGLTPDTNSMCISETTSAPVKDAVDSNTSDVDSSVDKGVETSFVNC
ncbi:Uncharacterised protein [uncultured archaeon]|nr:Uncharacterised protein [uncultured archaeon]